jgi:hypothetical protein
MSRAIVIIGIIILILYILYPAQFKQLGGGPESTGLMLTYYYSDREGNKLEVMKTEEFNDYIKITTVPPPSNAQELLQWKQDIKNRQVLNSGRKNNICLEFTGFFTPTVDVQMYFRTRSDDGVRLSINDTLIIDNWKVQSVTEKDSPLITFKANVVYPIKLEWYNASGIATLYLFAKVNQPEAEWEMVHSRAFTHTPSMPVRPTTDVIERPVPAVRPTADVIERPVPVRSMTDVVERPVPVRSMVDVVERPVPVRSMTDVVERPVPVRSMVDVVERPVPVRSMTDVVERPVPVVMPQMQNFTEDDVIAETVSKQDILVNKNKTKLEKINHKLDVNNILTDEEHNAVQKVSYKNIAASKLIQEVEELIKRKQQSKILNQIKSNTFAIDRQDQKVSAVIEQLQLLKTRTDINNSLLLSIKGKLENSIKNTKLAPISSPEDLLYTNHKINTTADIIKNNQPLSPLSTVMSVNPWAAATG